MSQETKLSDLPNEIVTLALDLGPKFRPTDLRYPVHRPQAVSFHSAHNMRIDAPNDSETAFGGVPDIEYAGFTTRNDTTFLCNIDHVNYSFSVELKILIMNNELAISEFEREIDNFINKVDNRIPAVLSPSYCWKFYTFNFSDWSTDSVPHQSANTELLTTIKDDSPEKKDHQNLPKCGYWDESLIDIQLPEEIPKKEDDEFIDMEYHRDEFIDMEYHRDSYIGQKIEYTGTHFKINNIILSKNARECIIDLAKYIKFILRKP